MTINFCGPWFLGLGCSDTIAPPPPEAGSFAGDRDCMVIMASIPHVKNNAMDEVASITEAATVVAWVKVLVWSWVWGIKKYLVFSM